MTVIELTLYSGEHLSTGRYTPDEVIEARRTRASLEVHGPDDPCPSFGVDRSLPARMIAGADIYTYSILG